MRTKSVDRSKYRNYLLKSEEFLVTAKEASERGRYNTCVLNAVHSII
jgi:HEPN domain-containing protein